MNKKVWVGGILAAIVVVSLSLAQIWADQEKNPKKQKPEAKNVILMIGDGMGEAQRHAIRLSSVGIQGEMAMDSMPYTGTVRTHSAEPEGLVTDSAAAATAMATGVKTYNGAIGVDRNKKEVKTVLEKASQMGKATGLVTTSQVTDGTPAAFASHTESRDDQSKIALQYLEQSQPDVILGGGENHWYPKGNPGKYEDDSENDPPGESKGTEGNLVKKAENQGYQYVSNREEMQDAKGTKLLGLFANEEMFKADSTDEENVYDPVVPLPEMTQKALQTLSKNKKGFFLIVEEQGMDSFGHVNDAGNTIKSGQQFDRSVALAKSFAKESGDTLVIVTGDHETGGFTIEKSDDPEYPDESGDGISKEDGPFPVAKSDQEFIVDWTTQLHTGVDVPLTAMGPGAELLIGVYENTHIHDVILKVMKEPN
ncbi:alkaline phosphatase [Paludifilum halophilum]|uniref:Alkaline phosphatase n=1 Tax=Paludifilum halophilum TaxID=1642702 RepID=A0A235BCG0_9BACL|nr:alkaline phosphatase [Paludifilum halophilum]OYD09968.1 alkaline phosphatase [Paludifilum halophilum]